jgi:hypothetical protein
MSTYEERVARALERARRGELAGRFVRAEVKVRPGLGGQGVLRLYGGAGNVDVIQLGDGHQDADGQIRAAASEQIHRRGYRLDGGWDEADACTLRSPLDVTRTYLEFVERRFGPVPELPGLPPGMIAHQAQRGRWHVSYENRRYLDLTWQPRLQGDAWRVWTGPQATTLRATCGSGADAITAITAYITETDARRAERENG